MSPLLVIGGFESKVIGTNVKIGRQSPTLNKNPGVIYINMLSVKVLDIMGFYKSLCVYYNRPLQNNFA